MKLIRMIRMFAGLLIGGIILTVLSPLFILSTYTPWPIETAPWLWGLISRYSSHQIAGVAFHIEGDLPSIDPDDVLIIYGNHPATIATSDFLYAVEQYIRFKTIYIASETAHPFILWPAVRLHRALVIPDGNSKEALRLIREKTQGILHGSKAALVFPEAHRWTPKRVVWQLENMSNRASAHTVLPRLLFPMSGGLWQIFQAFSERKFRVIEITNGMNYSADSFLQLHDKPAKFCLRIVEIDPATIPKDREGFDKWLNTRWLNMARQMTAWRD